MAVTSQSYAAAVILLRCGRVKCDVRNDRGETPLYLACNMGQVGLVNLLTEAGKQTTILWH